MVHDEELPRRAGAGGKLSARPPRRNRQSEAHPGRPAGPARRDAVPRRAQSRSRGRARCLIKAHAIGVGIPDCLIRAGTYSHMPPLPATPGTELVRHHRTSRSRRHRRVRVGQRVYTTARERPHRGGHYAEFVATPADATFILPDNCQLRCRGSARQLSGRLSHLQRCACARKRPDRTDLRGGRRHGQRADRSCQGRGAESDRRGHRVRTRRNSPANSAPITSSTARHEIKSASGCGNHGWTRRRCHHRPNRRQRPCRQHRHARSLRYAVGLRRSRWQGPNSISRLRRSGAGTRSAVRQFTIHTWDHLVEERRAGMRALIDMLAAGKLHPRIHAKVPLAEASRAHEMLEGGEVSASCCWCRKSSWPDCPVIPNCRHATWMRGQFAHDEFVHPSAKNARNS